MTTTSGAEIRARLGHPVLDADGHLIEARFALDDFIKEVGGARTVERFAALVDRPSATAVWVGPSGPHSIDRATAMLPKLFRARLDEAGIDFSIVYGTTALLVLRINDDELRRVAYRAFNMMLAELFAEVADRMTPAAVIPMHTPEEALAELDFAIGELGLKAVLMNTIVWRPAPEVAAEAPHLARFALKPTSPAIDQPFDYDPVWRRCVELGVAPTCHNSFRGDGTTHASPRNYVYNQIGSFAKGSELFCRALFFGGVTRRFPALKFGFLEGGVGWAVQLYNNLFEYWEKRNVEALKRTLDPAKLDVDLLERMFAEYGDGTHLTPERIRADPHHPPSSRIHASAESLDDFAAAGIARLDDIRERFVPNFYFGCEADDRLNRLAFDTGLNRLGARLKAVLGSDIGHWDVPDMTKVLVEAWELVEDGHIGEDDFRDFAFANAVELHTAMNPDFFKGTVLEDAVARLQRDR